LRVGVAAEGEEDGFAVGLAGLDVGSAVRSGWGCVTASVREKEGTHSISGQLRSQGLSEKGVHRSPALAKLVMGGLMPFKKAISMTLILSS
jgi:hypothetical protein